MLKTKKSIINIVNSILPIFFTVLLFFVFYLHLYLLDDYISLVDTSWVYAVALQLMDGKQLYKDVVWSVGPLPVIVEYVAQLIKPGFSTSVLIGLIIKFTFGIIWFDLLRKFANIYLALSVFIFLMTQNNVIYFSNWSTSWEILSISLLIWSILRIESVAKSFCIGLILYLLLMARQSSFVIVFVFVFMYIFWLNFVEKVSSLRSELYLNSINIIIGFGILVLGTFAYMQYLDILNSYIYEVFLSAADKKGVNFIHGIIDALTGGGAYLESIEFNAVNLLKVNLAPFISSVLIILILQERISIVNNYVSALLAVMFIVVLVAVGFDLATICLDYARVFVICSTIYLLFIERNDSNLAVNKYLLALVNMVAIGSVFSYELSHPGRGWGNFANVFPIAVLNLTLLCKFKFDGNRLISIVVISIVSFVSLKDFNQALRSKVNPFVEGYKTDYMSGVKRVYYRDDVLGAVKMPVEKESFLNKVKTLGIEGESCFIYTVEPVLYKLLNCNNPTNVYMVIGDFLSSNSAKIASEKLIANPPCFLITRRNWLAPIDEFAPDITFAKYEAMGREAQYYMHKAVDTLLPSYRLIFDFKRDIDISEKMFKFYGHDWESLSTHRVYINNACKK